MVAPMVAGSTRVGGAHLTAHHFCTRPNAHAYIRADRDATKGALKKGSKRLHFPNDFDKKIDEVYKMGGHGSGYWYRLNSKATTESQNRIDIRLLKKWGHLNDDSMSIGTWSWSQNSEETGSVGCRLNTERMVLNYRYRHHGGNWEPVEQHISFDRTPCNYGGHRLWFLCPHCSRRVAVLYGAGKYFLCRYCYRLTYSCQQESLPDRLMRKSRKIRKLLGGGNSLLDPFPSKPKNMHWETYYRLRYKAERANYISCSIWGQRLGINI